MLFRPMLIVLFAIALMFASVGCEDSGTAENAGEAVDDAVQDAGEALEDAGEEVGDAVEDAADEVEEATESQ